MFPIGPGIDRINKITFKSTMYAVFLKAGFLAVKICWL